MFKKVRPILFALGLFTMIGCSESVPETTMDGIFTSAQAERGRGLFTSLCEPAIVSKSLPGNHLIQFGQVFRQRPCMRA